MPSPQRLARVDAPPAAGRGVDALRVLECGQQRGQRRVRRGGGAEKQPSGGVAHGRRRLARRRHEEGRVQRRQRGGEPAGERGGGARGGGEEAEQAEEDGLVVRRAVGDESVQEGVSAEGEAAAVAVLRADEPLPERPELARRGGVLLGGGQQRLERRESERQPRGLGEAEVVQQQRRLRACAAVRRCQQRRAQRIAQQRQREQVEEHVHVVAKDGVEQLERVKADLPRRRVVAPAVAVAAAVSATAAAAKTAAEAAADAAAEAAVGPASEYVEQELREGPEVQRLVRRAGRERRGRLQRRRQPRHRVAIAAPERRCHWAVAGARRRGRGRVRERRRPSRAARRRRARVQGQRAHESARRRSEAVKLAQRRRGRVRRRAAEWRRAGGLAGPVGGCGSSRRRFVGAEVARESDAHNREKVGAQAGRGAVGGRVHCGHGREGAEDRRESVLHESGPPRSGGRAALRGRAEVVGGHEAAAHLVEEVEATERRRAMPLRGCGGRGGGGRELGGPVDGGGVRQAAAPVLAGRQAHEQVPRLGHHGGRGLESRDEVKEPLHRCAGPGDQGGGVRGAPLGPRRLAAVPAPPLAHGSLWPDAQRHARHLAQPAVRERAAFPGERAAAAVAVAAEEDVHRLFIAWPLYAATS